MVYGFTFVILVLWIISMRDRIMPKYKKNERKEKVKRMITTFLVILWNITAIVIIWLIAQAVL